MEKRLAKRGVEIPHNRSASPASRKSYEERLITNNFQPGEPRDKSLAKLIYNTRQKVSIGANSQPTVTLVIDLGQTQSTE